MVWSNILDIRSHSDKIKVPLKRIILDEPFFTEHIKDDSYTDFVGLNLEDIINKIDQT